jgi:hypothetical protein
MTKDEARQIASSYLKGIERADCKLVLLDTSTIEKSFGWVFFYQSKRYLETGEIKDALAGNAPIVVEKPDGRIHTLGTALALDDSIRELTVAHDWKDE